MTKGLYIVLEGIQGVGKTTQLQLLEQRLRAEEHAVRALREPDSQSDLTARTIRFLTQDPRYPMNTNTEVLLYNAARSQSLQVIKKSVDNGIICLVDRNYLTTLAIQYYARGDVPDYDLINTIITFAVNGVEPDLCIVLDAPVTTVIERLKSRYHGERFDAPDTAFLDRMRAGYLWEAKQRGFPVVHVTDNVAADAEQIWKLVQDALTMPSSSPNLRSMQTPDAIPIEPPVSLETHTMSMLDLSLFADVKLRAQRLLLTPAMTVEPLNTDDWFVALSLKPKLREIYTQAMLESCGAYTTLLTELTTFIQSGKPKLAAATAQQQAADIAQLVLPLAMRISTEMPAKLAEQGEAAAFTISEADKIMQTIAAMSLPANHTDQQEPVVLLHAEPQNELDLLPELLHQFSDQPLERIRQEVSSWPYDKQAATLRAYSLSELQGKGSGLLDRVLYQWDLVTDVATLREAASHARHLSIQPLSPRLGYEVPRVIERAGLSDLFETCFDRSLALYSKLQQAGYATEAQYAVLLGHRVRWSAVCSLRDIVDQTKSSPQLGETLIATLIASHPVLAETLKS